MKVFIYRPTDEPVDCAAVAYDEEGRQIGCHVSSNLDWAKYDMMKWHVPADAEVIWVIGKEAMIQRINAGEIRNLALK